MRFVVGLAVTLVRAFVALITALAVLVGVVVTVTVQGVSQVAVAALDGHAQRRRRTRARTERVARPVLNFPAPDPATRVTTLGEITT